MICPNCGSWVDEGEPMCSCGTSFGDDYMEYTCPDCHETLIINEFDTHCRYCGAPIKRDEYFY